MTLEQMYHLSIIIATFMGGLIIYTSAINKISVIGVSSKMSQDINQLKMEHLQSSVQTLIGRADAVGTVLTAHDQSINRLSADNQELRQEVINGSRSARV